MSLNGYIDDILLHLAALRREVADVSRENRELRQILTHSHHRWWQRRHEVPSVEDQIDELIHKSKQPEWLKY